MSLLGASGLALVLALQFGAVAPAQAQDLSAPATPGAAAPQEEITVTGSRIVRNGYDMPTPVTVVSTQDLQASAPANIVDYVNQLPAVAGSGTPGNNIRGLTSGAAGLNTVSLRNLGSNRTLILIDGHRTVASTIAGSVDSNLVPQGLIKSVEIVTGGASAVYGSDAVAGVVNYILDKTYTGIKGDLSYGQTTYGDDDTYKATITAGFKFAGDRGHVVLNGTIVERAGVYGVPRPWAARAYNMTRNPAYVPGNGQPEYMPAGRSGLNVTTGGGIILTGPARGTYFGSGGTVNHYDYGENYNPAGGSEWTIGGDYRLSQHYDGTSLQPAEHMRGAYGRLSYDVTDDISAFVEFAYNQSRGESWGGRQTDRGTGFTVKCDNAFIPAAVKAVACPTASSTFNMGTWNADIPTRSSDNLRQVYRYVVGAEGKFDLLDLGWHWDTYYQRGIAKNHISLVSPNRVMLSYASDAVWNADHTKIVCRVTAANQNDPLFAGCVPFNRMGIGVNTQEAVNYVMGNGTNPWTDQRLQQDVAALNFSTNITNPWLKPIGLAFGVEHRREAASGYTPLAAQTGWYSGNFATTVGHYNVTEGYVETDVSLPFNIDFNGAARLASYQQAGKAWTWKAGATWSPISDLRLRAVRSRDVRAPNLQELFAAGGGNTNNLHDPWNDNNARYRNVPQGNLNLTPEKADTWDLGVIYRPSFAPGLGFSVDYYDIKIKDAIDNLGAQAIVDRCFDGNESLCKQISLVMPDNLAAPRYAYGDGWNRTTGPVPGFANFWIVSGSFNYVVQRARGIDFEVSYQTPLERIAASLPGNLSIRGLATYAIEQTSDSGTGAPPTNSAGQNSGSLPKWKYRATVSYTLDSFTMQVTGRGFSAGVYNNTYVECASGCPLSTSINPTISNNHLPGSFYVDTYFSRKLPIRNVNTEFYLQINNIFNRTPAPFGNGPYDTSNPEPSVNRSLYDYLGRTFRIGVRFSL